MSDSVRQRRGASVGRGSPRAAAPAAASPAPARAKAGGPGAAPPPTPTPSLSLLASSLLALPLAFPVAFSLIAVVRTLGTVYLNLITDCDESMNYWEPTHYLLYGRGLQTWEYSPSYALRSYAYAGLHALMGLVLGAAWGADKITVFHRTRVLLALLCALCEAVFYWGVVRRFGRKIGTLTLVGLVASAGLLHAAPAYLPSSFSMYGLLLSWGFWLAGHTSLSLVSAVTGLLLGWPFAIVALVPMGLHMVLHAALAAKETKKAAGGAAATVTPGSSSSSSLFPLSALAVRPDALWALARLVVIGAGSSVAVLGLCAVVDKAFYGTWLLAPWNIILYNAFGHGGGGQGSNLYGVEPASYFVANLALNFNVIAVAALASPLALLALYLLRTTPGGGRAAAPSQSSSPRPAGQGGNDDDDDDFPFDWALAALSQLWFWFVIMSTRPHKEERFMFVVYPLLPLAAAFTIAAVDACVAALGARVATSAPLLASASAQRTTRRAVRVLFFGLAFALSAARIVALVKGYSAPFAVWTSLARHLQAPPASSSFSSAPPPLTALAKPVARLFPALDDGRPAAPGALAGARVCVGKEWYRFPTSYFLPERTREAVAPFPMGRGHTPGGPAELAFIRNNFTGLLPQPYLAVDGTSAPRTGFNDENRDESDRYVDVASCDYVVDLRLPPGRTRDAHYEPYFDQLVGGAGGSPCECRAGGGGGGGGEGASVGWTSLLRVPFLDAESTPSSARAFWVPWGVSESKAVWAEYHVLQKLDCCAGRKGG
jgi:alpha-1,2-mannosyltransferase